MPFITIKDVTLHYKLSGPRKGAPVLVFSNSLGTDFRIWDAVARAFAPSHTVLLYDKRGHGLSELGTAPATIASHAADLAGLMDALGLGPAAICGLSVGGMIAQALAAARPDLVRALILCDTAPKIGTPESWNTRIAAIAQDGLSSLLDPVMERWFTPAFRRADNPDYAGYRMMFARQSGEGYAATCAAIRDADLTDEARRIAVPTLCVVGDQDGSTPPDLVAAMAALIPGARYEVISGAGHIPCVEQPAALIALMRDFLAGLRPAADDRYAQGMETRRAVLGDAHVERANAQTTDFDRPFQQLITEGAWGTVWSRDTLSRRDRSLLTLALLAALNQHDEFAMHVRATANTGATREDVREMLLHVAIYAGVPAANHAIKLAKKAYEQMDGVAAV